MKVAINSNKLFTVISFIIVFLFACGGYNTTSTIPSLSYLVDNGDGTITDNKTGLIWQKTENTSGMTQEEAKKYCDELVIGSKDQWRLPTANELGLLYQNSGGEMWKSDYAYWSSQGRASAGVGITIIIIKGDMIARGTDINSKYLNLKYFGGADEDSPIAVRAVHD